MAEKTILKLNQVGKNFIVNKSKVRVLEKIDLAVENSEFICVIGPNGSGKTTLVKIIAGIEKPTNGTYQKSENIAYLPQQDSLLPWLTVRENIELPGRINNSLDAAARSSINKYLKKYDLSQFADFYPGEISGGMKQKAALIRAVAYKPQIIILDEPFSALDAITRIGMRKMLSDLWLEYKPTIICVTHDIEEAIFLSDSIFVLSERPGKIIKRFDVGLKRPRGLDDLSKPAILKLKKNLYRMLLK